MKLVIVESPSKAKTINKYLGKDYTVLASYGHVRDLSSSEGSVDPENNFSMTWEIDDAAKKHIKKIEDEAEKAEEIILATDPDREGEAISWQIYQILKAKKKIKNKKFSRVVFNAITSNSVLTAIENPRQIDESLVQAYLARRCLDYLVGYNISPILWRKLPGARSAGRVQSVALRIICDRESEIEKFVSHNYWSIEGILAKTTDVAQSLTAHLVEYGGKKLDKLDINSEEMADSIKSKIENAEFSVENIEKKQVKRSPYPPFTTSTLQQSAFNLLGFSSKMTMQIAQKLYEGIEIDGSVSGLITYMRTDGLYIAPEAINEARKIIETKYGTEYLPEKPMIYKSKAKNAQEAHEAIRPISFSLTPQEAAKYLKSDEAKLYELIWKRSVASQMQNALIDRTTVTVKCTALNDKSKKLALFRATGSTTKFNGFRALYQDDDNNEEVNKLPNLAVDENLKALDIISKQHATEAPPRFTEASIIKRLEELGIGRPSTYVSILSTLVDRKYIITEKKKLIPETKGRIVTEFLKRYFEKYVKYDFTANLEEQLDSISNGSLPWEEVLSGFWHDLKQTINSVSSLTITEVINALNEELAPLLFPPTEDNRDPRQCPLCKDGTLSLKLSKLGGFIGCSNYPECSYTRQIGASENDNAGLTNSKDNIIGQDSETGEDIKLLMGRFGPYVQRGDGKSAKKAAIPKDIDISEVNLELAQQLLSLPREIGLHPENNQMITASIGRYGPYLLCDGQYANITSSRHLLNVTLKEAVQIIEEHKKKKSAAKPRSSRTAVPAKVIAKHPQFGDITLHNGRFGPYVKAGKINASIPKTINPEEITVEEAIELINKKS